MPPSPPLCWPGVRQALRVVACVALAAVPCGCVAFGYGDAADVSGPLPSDVRSPVDSDGLQGDGGRADGAFASDGQTPSNDAAAEGEDGGLAVDGEVEAGQGGDAGPKPPKELALPSDGELASACYAPGECNGDDLLCFGAVGTAPGLCVEDCEQDEDCAKVGGLPARCTSGQCLVNCAGPEEAGDGPCPEKMECRQQLTEPVPGVLTPVVVALSDPNYWCVYPVDAGTHHVPPLGKCDPDHGNGDCEGDRVCHDPDGPGGSGYCAEACEEDGDCGVPGGVLATPACFAEACELDCSGAGDTCPPGMNCREVSGNLLSPTLRCVYID